MHVRTESGLSSSKRHVLACRGKAGGRKPHCCCKLSLAYDEMIRVLTKARRKYCHRAKPITGRTEQTSNMHNRKMSNTLQGIASRNQWRERPGHFASPFTIGVPSAVPMRTARTSRALVSWRRSNANGCGVRREKKQLNGQQYSKQSHSWG